MTLRWNDEARCLDLGVRDLLDEGDRRGRAPMALSDRARMRAGADLHRDLQATRRAESEGVSSEVTLRHSVVVRGWTCTVHGRADVVAEEGGRTVVEEIKSSLLDGDALAMAHTFPVWERQLAFYVSFAAAARRPDPVGRLRVVSLLDGAERIIQVPLDPALESWIVARLNELVLGREERLAWWARRRQLPVRFAHDEARTGQDAVVSAVEEGVRQGRHVLLVAPTGVGKTAAVLAGTLRAAAASGQRVWWATARTTQQAMVERTAAAMAARGTPVRSVTLRARERACRRGGEPCDPGACPLKEPAPDRLDAALQALAALGQPDADALARVAAEHRLCPYALALSWLERCDLVICDYNYAFDPDVRLRLALADVPHVLVVEEAHQLPDRACEWGSPSIDSKLVSDVFAALPDDRSWAPFRALAHQVAEGIADAALLATGVGDKEAVLVEANTRRWVALRDAVDDLGLAHAALSQGYPRPAPLPPLLLLAEPPPFPSAPTPPMDPWVVLARAVMRFAGALERAGEETVALWSPGPAVLPGTRLEVPGGRLALSCRDPSRVLGPRFTEAHATVSVSATLAPGWFYRDRCGMDAGRALEVEAPSPFPPERRRVLVVGGVSTEYKHRLRDRDKVADIVGRTLAAVPGNAAVFVSSFEQLRDLVAAVSLPGRELLVQTPAMDEGERARLLDRMRDPTAPRARVLVGVLGGLFAEGVDLPGEALRAVLVVGPALPPPTLERRLLQAWYEERFDQGFTLAYVQPGMTRVVQAGGRVVRGPGDRGVVVLICQRFLRNAYAEWLPAPWDPRRTRRPWEDVAAFFAEAEAAAESAADAASGEPSSEPMALQPPEA
ncbi:MAG: helicase C-terminal domain-containing protein [Pseudomonadota bacterium]|nr:helicase C-terminal domain-containing protein [Pseudomonadota bacterium]